MQRQRDEFDEIADAVDNEQAGWEHGQYQHVPAEHYARAFREAAEKRTCGNCKYWRHFNPPSSDGRRGCERMGDTPQAMVTYDDSALETTADFGCSLFEAVSGPAPDGREQP